MAVFDTKLEVRWDDEHMDALKETLISYVEGLSQPWPEHSNMPRNVAVIITRHADTPTEVDYDILMVSECAD